VAQPKRSRPSSGQGWDRDQQRRLVEAVGQLVALVHTLEGDIAVLRVQVDRLEKIGPPPRKSAAQEAELP
jgi:hypothetical protein